MQHSSVKYDDQFLYELGSDLIAAEKKSPASLFSGERSTPVFVQTLSTGSSAS
ncbi:hypothetical protein ACR6C2_33480 [Streptomyces sp. INA 01156]